MVKIDRTEITGSKPPYSLCIEGTIDNVQIGDDIVRVMHDQHGSFQLAVASAFEQLVLNGDDFPF